MKKRTVIALILFILLTTIIPPQKFTISKFNLKKIIIKNNNLISEKDIKKSLLRVYDKNLLILDSKEIENILKQNSYIQGFRIKKKYPDTLIIKIFEKRPIAILFKKKNKFYLSENMDLIKFYEFQTLQDLPYVFGDEKKFKVLYKNLKKINFPLDQIKKFILFETNRWDLETLSNRTIRLPAENYLKSLKNYKEIKNKKDFTKYKVFDYRIKDQLILR